MAILTSTGIQFSDGTQTTAGLPLTGGTLSGALRQQYLKVYNGTGYGADTVRNVRMYDYSYSQSSSAAMSLITNSNSYDDVVFQLIAITYHGSIGYSMFMGSFGGYGNSIKVWNAGTSTLSSISAGTGYNTLQITCSVASASIYLSMIIYGHNPVTVVNGTLR